MRTLTALANSAFIFLVSCLLFCCRKPGDFNANRISKTDIIWSKNYGTAAGDFAEAFCKAKEGGYIMAGTTMSNLFSLNGSDNSENFFVVKINEQGLTEWEKEYGGEAADGANATAESADGNFFIAGNTNSSLGQASGFHVAPQTHDAWIIKIDKQGKLLWQKTIGGYKNDDANTVVATPDGGCIIAGNTKSIDGDLIGMNEGLWIVKLSVDGNLQWQQTYGSSAKAEVANSITSTKDGSYILTGVAYDGGGDFSASTYYGNNDVFVLKISSSGKLLWQNLLGGSGMDWGNSIIATKEGGYVLTGFTESRDGDITGQHYDKRLGERDDMWIVKLDANGKKVWQQTLGGINTERGSSIIETSDGNFMSVGYSLDLLGQDDYSTRGRRGHGTDDIFVTKLSAEGNVIWEKVFGGTGIDQGKSIIETEDGNFILLARSSSNDVDISNNKGWYDFLLIKFKG